MTNGNHLPRQVMHLIDNYFNLSIADKKVRCPYYVNSVNRRRFGKRVFVGKGNPEEIVVETESLAKKLGVRLGDLSAREIREFMKEKGIGIDCSGLVSWILYFWYRGRFGGGSLWRKIGFSTSFLKRIRYILRPFENIGVKDLLNMSGLKQISKASEIVPGDLIHLGTKHIMIVYSVVKDLKHDNKEIFYCHSSDFYDGVHKGKIKVVNPEADLGRQYWLENRGRVNWSFEEYLKSDLSAVSRLELLE